MHVLRVVSRDVDVIPDSRRREMEKAWRQQRDVLLAAFPEDVQTPQLRAVVGHAVSFMTWWSLCMDNGLPDLDAVDAMTGLVMGVATPARR